MSICAADLWEINQALENGVERPRLVAGRGGNDVCDSSAHANLGLELEVEWDECDIIVWTSDLWSWGC